MNLPPPYRLKPTLLHRPLQPRPAAAWPIREPAPQRVQVQQPPRRPAYLIGPPVGWRALPDEFPAAPQALDPAEAFRRFHLGEPCTTAAVRVGPQDAAALAQRSDAELKAEIARAVARNLAEWQRRYIEEMTSGSRMPPLMFMPRLSDKATARMALAVNNNQPPRLYGRTPTCILIDELEGSGACD
jgi:hypothetical protein